jgi:LytS/YehU family sensor histidine kinase
MNIFMHDLSGVAEAHGLPNKVGRFNPARIALIFPFILVIFCSYCYRLYIDKIRQNDLIKEMETNHLKTELDFLRSQVSPHFMFNLMNTLVSMARKKSEMMEPSLISLSQLMRYMLYDSSGDKISLANEIEYLKSYINLQLLRFGDTVRFNLFVSGSPEFFKIEPMLLIPFVENAFKHGAVGVQEPMIEVALTINANTHSLTLLVSNNVNNELKEKEAASGIGLANVMRRLELLYPGKHHICIKEKE